MIISRWNGMKPQTYFQKKINGGIEIAAKNFLEQKHRLQQGDVLLADEQRLVVVDIIPCDCLSDPFADALQLASICYGNW